MVHTFVVDRNPRDDETIFLAFLIEETEEKLERIEIPEPLGRVSRNEKGRNLKMINSGISILNYLSNERLIIYQESSDRHVNNTRQTHVAKGLINR